jgi:hypothetical protein
MVSKQIIGKDLERIGRGLFEVYHCNFPGETEKSHRCDYQERIVLRKPDVSEEQIVPIFRVEE